LLNSIEIDPGLEVSLRASEATGELTVHWDPREGTVSGLPEEVGVGRKAFLYEVVSDHRFRVSSGSFFQSGPEAAQLLLDAVDRAAAELKTASTVVDAYAGVGLFSVGVTQSETRVIAIESSKWSSADCKANLANRDSLVERVRVENWRTSEPVDVVVADPSRTGLEQRGATALASCGAPVMVLVSCDPAAMARDTVLMTALGYAHEGTEVLDLFPNTHHIECVTRFIRN